MHFLKSTIGCFILVWLMAGPAAATPYYVTTIGNILPTASSQASTGDIFLPDDLGVEFSFIIDKETSGYYTDASGIKTTLGGNHFYYELVDVDIHKKIFSQADIRTIRAQSHLGAINDDRLDLGLRQSHNDIFIFIKTWHALDIGVGDGLTVEAKAGDGIFYEASIEVSSISPVPEPASLILLGAGILGLTGYRKRFRR